MKSWGGKRHLPFGGRSLNCMGREGHDVGGNLTPKIEKRRFGKEKEDLR